MTSLADVADDHRVTMDTSKDQAMLVHLPDKIVRFGQMETRPRGLSLNDPKRHLTKERHNKMFNENTEESDNDMPALMIPNDDDYDSSYDDSSDE